MSNKKYDVSELIHGFDFTEKVEWNGVGFSVKELIPLRDVMESIDYVTMMCFTDEGEYRPELKDFAVRQIIVRMYSDIALPKDIDDRYAFLYGTDIVDLILSHVNQEQVKSITQSINAKLQHMSQSNIQTFNAQINSITNEVGDLLSKVDSIFSGVSPDDISSIVKQIANGEFGKNEVLKKLIEANVGE